MVLSGLCQDSYIVVRRVQRPVSSCWAVVAPFLPYVPECVGGRLAEKCSTFFLSLGRSRAGSLMGLRAEQRRASRPLEKARCMWRSPEFIGDSSPAASVEGARRGCPAVALQSRVLHLRPPGSSCGPSSAVNLVTSGYSLMSSMGCIQETGTSSPRSTKASLSYGNRSKPPPQAVSSAVALLCALVRALIVSGGSGKGSPSYPARTQSQACRKHSPLSGL
jgi:hypothetical protein